MWESRLPDALSDGGFCVSDRYQSCAEGNDPGNETRQLCSKVPESKTANLIENGLTPVLPADLLQQIGYAVSAYPLTLIQAIITKMQDALASMTVGIIARSQGF
jgi:2-methylisocitrate lyase-like PEP mutase family enzyme